MSTSKELFNDLLKETMTYLKENHRPEERVHFDKSVAIEEKKTPPAQVKHVNPALKDGASFFLVNASPPPPSPPVKEEKKEPEPPPAPKPPKPAAPIKEPQNLKSVLLELAPNLYTEEAVPDDAVAQKKRFAWKEKRLASEVTLLSFESHSRAHLFLQNLATAIDARLRPARITLATLLENENRWDLFFESSALKHLIAFPIPFGQFPNLLKYYKENPQAKQKFLHTTPLFLLHPFSDYQTNPLLKKDLWSTLCTQLSS